MVTFAMDTNSSPPLPWRPVRLGPSSSKPIEVEQGQSSTERLTAQIGLDVIARAEVRLSILTFVNKPRRSDFTGLRFFVQKISNRDVKSAPSSRTRRL
jgi:hypothetical protein